MLVISKFLKTKTYQRKTIFRADRNIEEFLQATKSDDVVSNPEVLHPNPRAASTSVSSRKKIGFGLS